MKKLVVAFAAFAISTVAASAADLPLKAPPVLMQSGYWNGFYVGINGGGAWSPDRTVHVDETFAGDPFFSADFGARRVEGGFGGAQIGYNWQLAQWVLGFEADAQGAFVRGSSLATVTPYLVPGGTMTAATTEHLDFFSTFRGRAGFAWDRVLLYVTGGVAVGQTRTLLTSSDSFGFIASDTRSAFRVGYAVGAGGEYAFSPNWSAKLEYQYIDLGTGDGVAARESVGGVPTGFWVHNSNRFDYHTVRVGLNYKWDAPVVAKY